MHCLTFALVLVMLLMCMPKFLRHLESGRHHCRRGMVGYRQIRDDPNHTRYKHHTFEDVNPVLVYGDTQF